MIKLLYISREWLCDLKVWYGVRMIQRELMIHNFTYYKKLSMLRKCVMIKTKNLFFLNICIILILILSSNPLNADGCFFPYEIEKLGNSAESPNQRALIIHDGEKETLLLQVKYSGSIENFAWVIPVPVRPEANSISTAIDSIFQELHDITQPKAYRFDGYNSLGGGGSRDNKFDDNSSTIPSMEVQVWEQLQVGPFSVSVLSGTDSQALIDWLTYNGYHFPDHANSIVDFYIQKNWFFLATRVDIQSAQQESNSSYQAGLPALKMTFRTEKPVFPLRISELSSAKWNEIELYVAAPHRMVCASYQTEEMDRDKLQKLIEAQVINSSSSSNTGLACACEQITDSDQKNSIYDYESIFRNKILSYDRPTFVIEHASMRYTAYEEYSFPGSFNGYFDEYFASGTEFWLTRLRTILSPKSMTDDVTFIPDSQGDEWLILDIFIEDKAVNPWSASILSLPGFLLLPLFLFRNVRKRYSQKLILTIFLIFIATV